MLWLEYGKESLLLGRPADLVIAIFQWGLQILRREVQLRWALYISTLH